MIKKIFLILFCIVVLFSCGKKGDPEYKGQKKYNNLVKVV